MFQEIPETFKRNKQNSLNITPHIQTIMEIQSKINETNIRAEKILAEKWESLSEDEKRKMIEKINQEVSYQWDPRFWPKVAFHALPPILKNIIKHLLKK